ncbi:hypothetical protein NLJ89_g3583 [Agrocybe chaxingu]|uniref:Xylanolytic transcriptional activator regulatory domain-containing protein n=1 Tax=Agrocybe chaxingu TaxID=84603 RepID=A0A9W8K3Q2_9AGAR|nr:hypothetical protein NLJ89_g3583 [Agrocybe chaxingu]
MPVDNTRVVSSRRTQKKLTEEELQDIDRKRLKGILAAGQGTRFILADTEQLHEKIYEMSNRIRQLEDALAILQANVSDQRHPLLSDDLLKIKFGSEALNARGEPPLSKDEDAATTKSIDALGTLTLGSSGDVQYFGRSAGSETLMMKADEENADSSSDEDNELQPAPTETVDVVEKLAGAFPFSRARPNTDGLQAIELLLPPRERAAHLCKSYIDHASYFFRPIRPDDLLGDLFPTIYACIASHNQARSSDPDIDKNSSTDNTSPHSVAILCFIFALGALLDFSQPPFNSEAERYYDLGRAALSLRPIYDSANIDTVSALGLMATYNSLAGKRYTRDSAWCIMSFAAKLAQTIGLHRDSARWHMDNKTVQKRRNLFWEIFSSDLSHSLALGRPPSNHPSYVDCEFPIDEDASLSSDATETQAGFWRTKHRFARDIYNQVAEATLIARTPSYNTILDLDRKVREISFPASFNPYVTREAGADIFHSSSLALRDFYATMLYLHRSFFAQAMLDHPSNPLLSPFAPSFLTAYRSASIIIKASAHLFERCAAVAMRLWFLMNHLFSAAVILGTVMTRSPTSNIASMAMRDFNLAISLFERNAVQSQRAKIALGVLLKLKEKAARSYQHHAPGQSPTESASTPNGSPPFGLSDDLEDDLAIFGGQMRVLDRKASGKHHHRSMSSGGSAGAPGSGTTAAASSPSSSTATSLSTEVSPAAIPATLDTGTGATSASGIGLGLGLGSLAWPESILLWWRPATVSVSGQAHGGEPYSGAFTSGSNWLNGASQYLTGGRTSDEVEERGFGHIPHPAPHAGPSTSTQGQHLFFGGPTRHWSTAINFDGLLQEPGLSTGLPMFEPSTSNNSTTAPMHDTSFPSFHPPSDASMFDIQHAMNHNPLANLPPDMVALFSAGPSNPAASSTFEYPDISMGYLGMNGYSNGNAPQSTGGFYPHDLGMGPTISMDHAGAIDMGLSSESGMDASWLSFMRDCGIMDTDG